MGLWIYKSLNDINFNGIDEIPQLVDKIEEFNKRPLQDPLLEVFYKYTYLNDPITTSGYVVDTLKVALWGIAKNQQFEKGLIHVVNLGGDADTAGAVFGQLAGALYGLETIPDRWKNTVYQNQEIIQLAERLVLK